MKRKAGELPPPVFPRADPVALKAFDPKTKRCTMNCGPCHQDTRDARERMFLCDECDLVTPP